MELDFPEREERQCVRKGGMISFAQARTTPVILARGEVGGANEWGGGIRQYRNKYFNLRVTRKMDNGQRLVSV